LSAFAIGAFWTDPIGHVSDAEKLGHNVGVLVLVTLVGLLAVHRGGSRTPRVSVAA
jgi:hypothetical protein